LPFITKTRVNELDEYHRTNLFERILAPFFDSISQRETLDSYTIKRQFGDGEKKKKEKDSTVFDKKKSARVGHIAEKRNKMESKSE